MERPAVLTSFGYLNLIFASVGMLGVVAGTILFTVSNAPDDPFLKALRENEAYREWLRLAAVPVLLACGALLVAGLGLLRVQPWARLLSFAWGAGAVCSITLNLFVCYQVAFLPLFETAVRCKGAEGEKLAGEAGAVLGLMAIFSLVGFVYPFLLLVVMGRRTTQAAFGPPPEPPPLPPAA